VLESPKMAGRDVMKLVVACAVSFGAALAGSFLAVGSDVPGWHDRRGRYPGRGAIHRFGRCRLVSRNYALSAEADEERWRYGRCCYFRVSSGRCSLPSMWFRCGGARALWRVNLVMAVCVLAIGSLAVRGVGLLGAGWIESSGFGLCSLLPLLPTIPTSGSSWSKTSRASNALLPPTRSC